MKIRFESSAAHHQNLTGVGRYTKRLIESVRNLEGIKVHESQFDFRGRHLPPEANVERINFPQKIYAKLNYYGVAQPFDLTLPPVDVTVFPNYALWPTIKSKKRVVTIHDLSFLRFPEVVEEKNLKYLHKIVPRAVHKSDLILTVSQAVKDELVAEYHIDSGKVFVTPIPPTSEYFQPSNLNVTEKYKIPTINYILYLGTVEPRKNIGVLVDAYISLPKKIKESHSLVITGGIGWKSGAIKERLVELQKAGENIVTTGFLDQNDIAATYQQASVYVLPSLYEGFGMMLLEAMAAKTPTIASDIPVLREVGGEATLYFPPDDAELLASHIMTTLNDQDSTKNRVEKGIKNLEKYSWIDIAQRLQQRFEKLLED